MNFIKDKKNVDTKVSQQELSEFLDEAWEDIQLRLPEMWEDLKKTLLEKNEKYKGASFEGGAYALIGNMFRQQDKMNRYRYLIETAIEEGEVPEAFGESIYDTIQDQAGYALIGLALCKKLEEDE